MLQAIREKAQGWIAWAIVILISIPFALFGIQQYLGVDANPAVATVNGTEITTQQLEQRVRDFRENLRRQLGSAFNGEMFSDKLLKPQVLQAMIDEALLRQAAEDWNMRISDRQVAAYIQSLPGLQSNGRFDMALYEATVRNRGLTKAGFEALVREEMLRTQQQQGIRGTVVVTEAQLADAVRLGDQRRQVELVRIPAAAFADRVEVSEKEARQYYEGHKSEYQVPERVKLAYIKLDVKDLADQVAVDEDKLRQYFDEHRGEFMAEQERRVRHILVGGDGQSDEEQRKLAEQILAELKAGADFAELAGKYSKDPGSAAAGGDLGWVNRGVMVKPFEEAVFAAKKGELVGPVKTEFGYHIIQVTDLRGGQEVDFDQVRDKVEAAYRRSQAEELYYDYLERLADLVYESPDSLVPAAEALGLKVRQTDWVTRTSPPPDLDSPKVLNAAFSDDVLGGGNNSDAIELSPTSAAVIRVVEHEEQTVEPFEQVKDKVVAAATREKASEKAREAGKALLRSLRQGKALADEVAGKGWKIEQKTLSRQDAQVPAEVARAAFDVAPPPGGEKAFTGVVTAEGDYVVVTVDKVIEGDLDTLSESERKKRKAALERGQADAEFRGLLEALRARADIEIDLK